MKRSDAITLVAAKAALGATMALGIVLAPSGHAEAPGTVNLTNIPVEDYPVCQEEDCSDVPNQEGLWQDPDKGDWYFIQGDKTWVIADNTVTHS